MAAGADLLGGRDDRPLRAPAGLPPQGRQGPVLPNPPAEPGVWVTGKQAPRRPGPDGRSSPLVRAGSAAHRKPLVPGGHQRVTTGMQACGTTHLHGQRPRPLQEPDGGFEPLTPTAAVGLRPLPTRQVVTLDGPHPPVELVTIAASGSKVRPRRPCPPRARSIGVWRSHTDNSGRSGQAPELRHRRSIRVERVPGRAARNRGPARMAFQHS